MQYVEALPVDGDFPLTEEEFEEIIASIGSTTLYYPKSATLCPVAAAFLHKIMGNGDHNAIRVSVGREEVSVDCKMTISEHLKSIGYRVSTCFEPYAERSEMYQVRSYPTPGWVRRIINRVDRFERPLDVGDVQRVIREERNKVASNPT